jgi:RimJ/RimL family protein N-acetyltransferase
MMLRGNDASARVAEKAGFVEEGLLRAYAEQRGVIKDVVMWTRVKSQSRSYQASGENTIQ